MQVIAAPGHRVPKQDDPRKHIEAAPADAIEVPDTSYYRRRLAEGELLPAKKPRGGAKESAKGVDE
jgi:hypothetical protein